MRKQSTDAGKKGELSNRMADLEARRGIIEEVDESLGESEVSRLSEFQYYMNDEYVENLKDYNSRRRKMLPTWQVPIPEEAVPNEQNEVEVANQFKENRCTGNLEISLFWEEKIIILIRVMQLYSVFFLYYYEHWPSKTRAYL